MTILTQDELNPLQEVRRAAEEHIEAIRAIGLARLRAMPRHYASADEVFAAEHDRCAHISEVVAALQTIFDAVSALEFEDEAPPVTPEPEPVEEDDPEPEDEDEEEEEEEED